MGPQCWVQPKEPRRGQSGGTLGQDLWTVKRLTGVLIHLWASPHGTGTQPILSSATETQEVINNLFMTFNKTQTSPHWHLIKESVQRVGEEKCGGAALTLSDWDLGAAGEAGRSLQSGTGHGWVGRKR